MKRYNVRVLFIAQYRSLKLVFFSSSKEINFSVFLKFFEVSILRFSQRSMLSA